jgi:PPK2 family polyphosphate:nucleotide phosphotransferase
MKRPKHDSAAVAAKYNISAKHVEKLLARYRVENGRKFRLKDHDPGDTGGHAMSKDEAQALLTGGVDRLSEQQERLYAQDQWSVLCLFQAMDAAGKDGTIKHVMSGINPQGVEVTSFKQPGPEALAHDFLWRANLALPERGRIGIFNRSYYEEVLVVRVHPEILKKQRLPKQLVGKGIWKERLESIAAYERFLTRQGIVVLKFFLNLSKEEQKRRFLSRLDEPEKNWKFSAADLAERGFWDDYQDAYEAAIRATALPHAPWYVVPADNKWFTRLIVVAAMYKALHDLKLQFPTVSDAARGALQAARVKLEAED